MFDTIHPSLLIYRYFGSLFGCHVCGHVSHHLGYWSYDATQRAKMRPAIWGSRLYILITNNYFNDFFVIAWVTIHDELIGRQSRHIGRHLEMLQRVHILITYVFVSHDDDLVEKITLTCLLKLESTSSDTACRHCWLPYWPPWWKFNL